MALPVQEGQIFQQLGANNTKTANYGVLKNGQVYNFDATKLMNQELGVSDQGMWSNANLTDQQKQQAVADWHTKFQQSLGGNVTGLDANLLSNYLVNPTTYGKAAFGGHLNSLADLQSYAAKPTTSTAIPDDPNSDWYKREHGLLPAQQFADGKYIGSSPTAPENMTDQQRLLAGFSTKDGVQPYSGALAIGGTPTALGQPAPVPTAKSAAYSVAQGDTLSSIARKNGTTVEALMAANPSITNPNLIRAGQNINIPGGQLPANQVSKGMTDLRAQVDATNGGLSANKDFVNGAFQAYLGRPASLQELSTFAGKTVQEVRDQLASGAIKPTLTPDKSSSVNIALLTDNKNLDLMLKSGNAGDSSGVNSFLSGTTAIQGQALDQVGQLEQQHNDIVKTLMSSMDKLGTKGQELLKLEESMGITQDMNRLKEINAQIAAKMNEVTAQTQAIQGTRASSLIQSGEVAKMQREKAIEIGMLQTQQQALLGNIELAKSTAQRTLELEFAPVQAALDKAQLFLQINSQDLSRADQKKATATAQALKVQQDAIDEAKQERQQNVELMLKLASSGIDTSKIDLQGSYADNVKATAPLLARFATAGQAPRSSGSSGGSGEGMVSIALAKPTFEQYVAQKEKLQGVSLTQDAKQALLPEYQAAVSQPTDPRVAAYTKLVASGTAITAVPKEIKDAVVMELAAQQNSQPAETNKDTEVISMLNQKVSLIDSLLTSKGLAGSVGPYKIARLTPFSIDAAERQDFAAGVNQLVGKDTLDALLNLKKQGGTLGALSEGERVVLQQAASKIGSWMIRDKNGIPTGEFAISEDLFKKELNKIKTVTQNALAAAGGDAEIEVVSPDGTTGTIPASQLQEALAAGYKKQP